MSQILNKVKINNQGVREDTGEQAGNAVMGNGSTAIFESAEITLTGGDNALDLFWKFENNLPDPEVTAVQYFLRLALQKKDAGGNWHTFWTQPLGFNKLEIGNEFSLEYAPNIFNDSPEQPFEMTDGTQIVAREYTKQGYLPTTIRYCVLVNEQKHGLPEAFQSVEMTIEDRIFTV